MASAYAVRLVSARLKRSAMFRSSWYVSWSSVTASGVAPVSVAMACAKNSTTASSQSLPPSWWSPPVEITFSSSALTSISVTSKVPPPRS